MKPYLYPRPLHLAMAQALVFGTLTGFTANAAEPQQGDTFKKPGFYTENFHILPLVEATAYYDDNIYATKRAKASDLVGLISPRIELESLWETHSLDLDAGAHIGRYADNTAEDYGDFWLSGDGEVDFTTESQLYVSAGYSNNHESRDSKEGASQQIDEPTTYDVRNLQLGVKQLFGKTSTKLGLTHEALDYDNVGSLYSDDRDRSVNGLGLRVSHGLSQQTQFYAQAIMNQRDYDDRQDQYGYVKDSEGYTAVVGITQEYASGHKLDAYLGHLNQDYDDKRFDQVSALNYGLDLRWYPTKKTQLTGKLDRSLNETTEQGASGYLFSAVDLQIDQKLATDFLGYVNYNHGLAEYQDVGREDATRTVSLGFKYYASPWVMITGSYSNIYNDSNDVNRVSAVSGTNDFKRNLFLLTLRARLAP